MFIRTPTASVHGPGATPRLARRLATGLLLLAWTLAPAPSGAVSIGITLGTGVGRVCVNNAGTFVPAGSPCVPNAAAPPPAPGGFLLGLGAAPPAGIAAIPGAPLVGAKGDIAIGGNGRAFEAALTLTGVRLDPLPQTVGAFFEFAPGVATPAVADTRLHGTYFPIGPPLVIGPPTVNAFFDVTFRSWANNRSLFLHQSTSGWGSSAMSPGGFSFGPIGGRIEIPRSFTDAITDLELEVTIAPRNVLAGFNPPAADLEDSAFSAVRTPEPGALALTLLGGVGAMFLGRRRRARREAASG